MRVPHICADQGQGARRRVVLKMRGVGESERHVVKAARATNIYIEIIGIIARLKANSAHSSRQLNSGSRCDGLCTEAPQKGRTALASEYGYQEGGRVDSLPSQPKRLLEEIPSVPSLPYVFSLISPRPGDVAVVNPEISSGLPLPDIHRFPPPGSRPEKYSTPATKGIPLHMLQMTWHSPPITQRPIPLRILTGSVMFAEHTRSCRS